MSLINIAKVIRTAIMAKDVRENIAKGFEEANSSINKVDGKIGNKDSELDNWMSNRNTEFENWKNATNENIDYRLNAQNMNIASNAEKIESVEKKVDAITDEVRNARHVCLAGYYNGSISLTKYLTSLTLTEGYNKVGYELKNDTTIKLKKNKIYKLAIQFRYSLKTAPTIQKYMNNFYINVQKGSSSAIYTGIGGIKSFTTIITDECVIERVFDTLNLDSDDLSLQIPSVTTLDEVKEYTDVKVILYELTTC
jgi:hypothetical protein|nr:MAG TPA: hypothetical protein [Caudoviricetes sp.]